MATTLAAVLAKDAVPLETLHARYGALLELVRRLIGVVPNCDPYLEIWPPAFRTYNVLVPNFLNLPLSIWGVGLDPGLAGLAMYVSSRTAACAYCSAHTCSFALRRGARRERIERALDQDDPARSPAEQAAVAVARALSRVPSDVTSAQRAELERQLGKPQAEWLVASVAMMGFLNKFMDAIGVELEDAAVDDSEAIIAPSGWRIGQHGSHAAPASATPPRADGIATKLGVVPYIPAALAFDRRATRGVPDDAAGARAMLRELTGHDFPLLAEIGHGRIVRAITAMLRDNLDERASVVGLDAKLHAGAVFARRVGDAALLGDVLALARHRGVDLDAPQAADGTAIAAVVALAEATSPSPAEVDDAAVTAARSLSPAAIVEIVTWIGVLQMLHRLTAYYGAS
jgi:alkylhydroperoxidase family enzyme